MLPPTYGDALVHGQSINSGGGLNKIRCAKEFLWVSVCLRCGKSILESIIHSQNKRLFCQSFVCKRKDCIFNTSLLIALEDTLLWSTYPLSCPKSLLSRCVYIDIHAYFLYGYLLGHTSLIAALSVRCASCAKPLHRPTFTPYLLFSIPSAHIACMSRKILHAAYKIIHLHSSRCLATLELHSCSIMTMPSITHMWLSVCVCVCLVFPCLLLCFAGP